MISNKTGIFDWYQNTPQVLAARSFLVAGFDTHVIPRSFSCGVYHRYFIFDFTWFMWYTYHVMMLKAKSWVPSSYIRIAHHSEFSDPIRIHIAFQILWNATRPRGSARADGVPNPDLAHHSEFSDPIRIHRIWNAMWIRIRIAFQIRIWNAIRPRTWKTFCYQKVLTSAYAKQCFGTHFSGAPWYICWRYFLSLLWTFFGVSDFFSGFFVEKDKTINVWCSLLTGVAVCCSLLDSVCVWTRKRNKECCSVHTRCCVCTFKHHLLNVARTKCVALCCSRCSVLQCVAVVGLCIFVVKKKQQNVLQCVAV